MNAPTLVAAAVVAAVVLLVVPGPPRHRLSRPGADERAPSGAWRDRLARRWRPGAAAARRRAAAVEVADAFAAELRAGRAVREALVRAAGGHQPPPCPAAVAACGLGGDVVSALRLDAAGSGVALWSGVAACWSVGESSGAGLAAALERVVAGARADEEVRREVEAALAAPRATAKVLAVLRLFGVAFGTALGADPVGWLLGSPVGWVVLAAGLGLALGGVAWTRRIADAVADRL